MRGIVMTGGSNAKYIEALSLFCKDANARQKALRGASDETGLPMFISQAHAIKKHLGRA
jgi:hypothetical protein